MQPSIRSPRTLILLALAAACGPGAGSSPAGTESAAMAPAAAPAPTSSAIDGAEPPMGEVAAQAADAQSGTALGSVASRARRSAPPASTALEQRPLTGGILQGTVDPAGAMLVRQGHASLEVKHLDDGVARVREAAARYGGFVANASVRAGRDDMRAATLEVRVPTNQFDALVGALGAMGKVESLTASAQDVADEYIDLTARTANARRVEARLTELLATRTGRLSDILTVEQELARVRGEVERYESRLKFLERKTSLSTLELALHEPLGLLDREPGPGPIALAFASAWQRAVAMLAWCIASLGILVPVGLAVAAVVVGGRRLRRTPAARGAAEPEATPGG